MSYSNSTLILRNLRDVFGENDPARRRAVIDEIYNEDCVFYDPNRRRSSWPRTRSDRRCAGVIKATHPDFQYRADRRARGVGRWRAGPVGVGYARAKAASLRRD